MGASVPQKAPDPFLAQLELALPSMQAEIADAFAVDEGRDEPRRHIVAVLRGLAGQAASRDLPLIVEELSACEALLQGAMVFGTLDDHELDQIGEAIGRVEAFVLGRMSGELTPVPSSGELAGSAPARPAAPAPAVVARRSAGAPRVDIRVVALGMTQVKSQLDVGQHAQPGPSVSAREVALEVEAYAALEADPPDVIVVDADLPVTREIVARLMETPPLDAVPLIALGHWARPEDAAPFVALGVARCLPKPVSPGGLYRAVVEVAPIAGKPTRPIGQLTLDQLGARLAEEMQRGLCDAAAADARRRPIDFEDGTEVLSAMWMAVGHIRRVITARSRGTVRFEPRGPEAALPRLPGPMASPSSAPAARDEELPLDGCTVLVAEDDLSTNWFLTGVLREAGAHVVESFDGGRALWSAYRHTPDLVLSDIVMPVIDGVSLCRMLKRDLVLGKSSVALLSWKEDLLGAVRELRAGADGYMLKESSGESVRRRVLELLGGRIALRERVRREAELEGDLDDITPCALLELLCVHRPSCHLTLRTPSQLFEISLDEGRPVHATRTDDDGGLFLGAEALASVLGVASGHFRITEAQVRGQGDLRGSLRHQLREPLARARSAQWLLSGAELSQVGQITFDQSQLEALLHTLPVPARGLLRALDKGVAPLELIRTGRASADRIEGVLELAVRRALVAQVLDRAGRDRLAEAMKRMLALAESGADDGSWPAAADAEAAGEHGDEERFEAACSLAETDDAAWHDEEDGASAPQQYVNLLSSPSPVVHEEPEAPASEPPPPIAPLRIATRERDATTPILSSAVKVTKRNLHITPMFASAVAGAEGSQLAELDAPKQTPAASPVHREPPREVAPSAVAPAPAPAPVALPSAVQPLAAIEPRPVRVPRPPRPSDYVSRSAPRAATGVGRFVWPLLFAVLGVGIAVGARWMRERTSAAPPLVLPPPALEGAMAPTEAPAPATEPGGDAEDSAKGEQVKAQVMSLSKEDREQVGKGQGLLEIVAGRDDKVFVNGTLAGHGPVVKKAVKAVDEPYEIRVKLQGEERVNYVVVEEGKRMRLRVAPPWR